MRPRHVYGRGEDLPAFEALKHRIPELHRHAAVIRACDYCFSHHCYDARPSGTRRNWKNHRPRQHR